MNTGTEVPSGAPDVLELAHEGVAGIFWCTSAPLEEMPWPFHPLDYLFDGLLSEALRRKRSSEGREAGAPRTHFYMGRNFGKSLSLMHVEGAQDGDELGKQIMTYAQTFSKNREGGRDFLLFTDSAELAKSLEARLKKKDKDSRFTVLHS